MSVLKIIKILYKTVYFNFYYFNLGNAIKFPVLINHNVYFKKLSGEIFFNCILKKGMIRIGFPYVGITDDVYHRTILELNGKLFFNGSAKIGSGSKISVGKNGILELGDNFVITSDSTLICMNSIKFGLNCLLSWDILIMDTDFHSITYSDKFTSEVQKPICIGNDVWIGCRTIILKGAKIYNNSVVGANSKLTKDYEKPNVLIEGNPAHVLKEIKSWNY